MDDDYHNDGCRRFLRKAVVTAHVAETRPAEVMDVIVFPRGLAGGGVAVAPVPSGADAGVVEVCDVAVGDGAVRDREE